MNNSFAVANKILDLAVVADKTVTPMQLIKLVYLCHAWSLGLTGKPLIDEHVEAWRYGPVIRSLYQKVKDSRDFPVNGPLKDFIGRKPKDEFSVNENEVIEQVYNLYGDFSGISLSNLTHKIGSPWSIIWDSEGENSAIPNDLIEHHYKQLYKELSNEECV